MFLKISLNSQENICARVNFLIKLQDNFIKKETLAQVFSCEYCKIFKSTFFIEHLRGTASELKKKPFTYFYRGSNVTFYLLKEWQITFSSPTSERLGLNSVSRILQILRYKYISKNNIPFNGSKFCEEWKVYLKVS